jgi:hypothetical protein
MQFSPVPIRNHNNVSKYQPRKEEEYTRTGHLYLKTGYFMVFTAR